MKDSTYPLQDKLEHLLAICNDGKEGYQTAVENIQDEELKSLFQNYAGQRKAYAAELKSLISQLGGDKSNTEGGALGMLHRAWIDLKGTLTGNDRSAIIDACITGDQAALDAYDDVLDDEGLNSGYQVLLNKQRLGISEALHTLEKLDKTLD